MLSVVVTIADGGESLERCLRALGRQEGAPDLEIIVPYDDSLGGIRALQEGFPDVRFLNLGALPTERPLHTPAGQHELFDRRRSAGLAAATGELVAVIDDLGTPRPGWARAATQLRDTPAAAMGGAIEHANRAALNWALYLCDYGRYQLPFTTHDARYVSDANICYKRQALDATRQVWFPRYHESSVHWAMQRGGETLWLTPEMVVDHDRGQLQLGAVLMARRQFGRLFAYTRARESSTLTRALLAAATPVLPLLLLARIARRQWRQPGFADFARALPALLLLLFAWSAGEAVGYVTGRA